MSAARLDFTNRSVSATAQAADLFGTPVIVDQYPGFKALNAELREIILKRQEEHPGIAISNEGGWHSDTRMLEWGGGAAMRLCEMIIAVADQFTVDLKADDGPRYKWYPEMWANVSSTGALNRHHSHPGSFWSAVYYVDDGYEGSTDKELGGELVLFDPRMPMIRMNAPDLRFRRPGQPPDHDENRFRPSSGRFLIFPSWLNHSVRAYSGSGLRISVAVNLTAVPAAVAPGG